jgi:putative heme-binding domain-containing protein
MRRWTLALALTALVEPAQLSAQERTPWTESAVRGSPEPALPLVAEEVFSGLGLRNALELETAPGSNRFFVVERGGRILVFVPEAGKEDPHTVIDLKAARPEMQNAYGIAFHPDWKQNGRVFVTYTLAPKTENGSRLSRFELAHTDPPVIDPESEVILLTWLSGGHNGAHIQFGPDGFLYLTTGDGEVPTPPDPRNTGQDISDLLGSVLRLDVDREEGGLAYAVPPDNPFLGEPGARPEIWAYGLRNPWKISFGEKGELWCGDVGWELWEMIHLVTRGSNHGWSTLEASQPVRDDSPPSPSPITPPVIAHPHTEAASITGGYVYTGERHPELRGAYVYGDYETGKIWALRHDGSQITEHREIADTPHRLVSFGRAPNGELYYLHFEPQSTMHWLVPNPKAGEPSAFPRTLSETGLFADLSGHVPADGVYEYEPREPMWQDGASARRFVALPEDSKLKTKVIRRANGRIQKIDKVWPEDAVLAKTLFVPSEEETPIETQLLHHDGFAWKGYTYRWRSDGKDADLVGKDGDRALVGEGEDAIDWRFHARGECDRCHTVRSGVTLGFQPEQVAAVMHGDASGDPVGLLESLGLVDGGFRASMTERPATETEIELQARDWLHSNCAHCHRQAAGGSAAIRLDRGQTVDQMALLGEKPLRGELGIAEGRLVMSGVPWRSVLVNRIARSGAGHMPIIGPQTIDVRGMSILWDWIESLPMAEADPRSAAQRFEDERDTALLTQLASGKEPAKAVAKLVSHAPGALRLVHAIDQGAIDAEVRAKAIEAGLAASSADVRALFDRFRPAADRLATVGAQPDAEAILKMAGDVEEGRALLTVTGKMAVCLGCHQLRGEGRNIGPELSTVGARLKPLQLLESLVEPSKEISEGYQTVTLTPKDGQPAHTGFILDESGEAYTLRSVTGETHSLDKGEVAVARTPGSLMPEGLIQGLTAQELADLLAYLSSLK